MYTSHIQNYVHHSEGAKVYVNCVSPDNNNQAHGEDACSLHDEEGRLKLSVSEQKS